MHLYIIDSILHYSLRPKYAVQAVEDIPRFATALRDVLRKAGNLITIENAANVIDYDGTMELKKKWGEEDAERKHFAQLHELGFFDEYQKASPISGWVKLDDVLIHIESSSPIRRVYHNLTDIEQAHLRRALMEYHRVANDDGLTRSMIRHILADIKAYMDFLKKCTSSFYDDEAINQILLSKLILMQMEIVSTFEKVISQGDITYERDFQNLVYYCRNEDPTEEEVRRFNEMVVKPRMIIIEDIIHDNNSTDACACEKEPNKQKSKSEKLYDALLNLRALDIPKIKELGSEEKIKRLLELVCDKPPHTCAFLEFIKLQNWVQQNIRQDFNVGTYEIWGGDYVLENGTNAAYHNLRMAANPTNQNANRYKTYQFTDQVKKEYDDIRLSR